ncbi:MAG: tRNA (adenosine(37)-N6)-threonylcarbamoyltransferase complex dimerization subunit type 1 TsaB [Candidatus Atribacteria bacterium]|nr:tRNA (adenosine(37)-N6)-threonylcarbamoyltransferase complex dimerization subunit type 1 TsaB [Candidatus Atribacteria bacterium]
MILAVETSTCWMSMGLFEKERSLFEVNHYTTMGHSQLIFRYLEILKKEFGFEDSLEAVVVGLGPGFFTGVKIAAMIGKSLAYTLKKPVYGFSTLEVMANQVSESEACVFPYRVLVPVVFHKKNEIFWTEFGLEFRKHTGNLEIQVGSPDTLVKSLEKLKDSLIITPWIELKEYFESQGLNCYDPLFSFPKAYSLARLYFQRQNQCQSDWTMLFQLVPIYGSKAFGQ